MKIKKLITIITSIILITWFIFYINVHIDEFKQIKLISYDNLIYLFLLALFFLINNGLVLKYLMEPFKIKLSFKEWFGLSIISTLGNYLTPFRGGAGARAIYLKKKYDFSYSYFLSSLAAIYIIVFLINSFVGILSTILIYLFYDMFSWLIFSIFFIIFLFLLFVIILSPQLRETKYWIINKFIKVTNGWNLIKSNKKIIFYTSLITFFNIIIIVLMMYLEFRVFGIQITLIQSLFLSIIATLGLFISITPGALGIREVIIIFSAQLVNINPMQALSVAILDRVIGLIIVFILGPIFSYILIHKRKNLF